jgi:N-acetylneuraminic acid mutarotase
MLLFGGFSNSGRFNDLWQYDLGTGRWIEIDDTGSVPSRRCLHVSTYIESTGEMLVFGGIQGGGNRASDFFDDTHLYNPQSRQWRRLEITGPGKRSGAIAFYASAEDAVFLWGGKQVNNLPNTLWRFDVGSERWSEVATQGDSPAGREDPIHFWDDSGSSLFMASGGDTRSGLILLDDIYRLNLATRTWQRLSFEEAPPPRWRGTLTFDPGTRKGYLFGGWRDFGGHDALNDLWALDIETMLWTQLQ